VEIMEGLLAIRTDLSKGQRSDILKSYTDSLSKELLAEIEKNRQKTKDEKSAKNKTMQAAAASFWQSLINITVPKNFMKPSALVNAEKKVKSDGVNIAEFLDD